MENFPGDIKTRYVDEYIQPQVWLSNIPKTMVIGYKKNGNCCMIKALGRNVNCREKIIDKPINKKDTDQKELKSIIQEIDAYIKSNTEVCKTIATHICPNYKFVKDNEETEYSTYMCCTEQLTYFMITVSDYHKEGVFELLSNIYDDLGISEKLTMDVNYDEGIMNA